MAEDMTTIQVPVSLRLRLNLLVSKRSQEEGRVVKQWEVLGDLITKEEKDL